ncbi:HesA/MoeB/ThiF family protein [Porphyromonas sp. oral taxon 275]|uniref:HesA/MoeB/ThiF family protein n=1 Tax=Porphyromonas sp. oral taxon 275 TaxID=712435 RepID=UPI001BA5F0D8|nr:HesA/MoeB/ThiF family protein [Porphyromonas sp. oral taxon 275]QUB42714.1 HesA/MoeB/ThiF family protein [Porphyromonas sp. oral taxon 275]
MEGLGQLALGAERGGEGWTDEAAERYQRQLLLPELGLEGQQRLGRARVAVVGAGGLGSTLLPLLVGAGVGQLRLCDGDSVSRSNLPRQTLYRTADLGGSKARLAAERLSSLNPHCQLIASAEYLSPENAPRLLGGVDLILDATDNEPARRCLDAYSRAAKLPWLYASAEGWGGQLALFLPGRPGYAELFPEAPAPAPSEAGQGSTAPAAASGGRPIPVLATTPALIASLAATEALKYLLGLPTTLADSLLLVDSLGMRLQRIQR